MDEENFLLARRVDAFLTATSDEPREYVLERARLQLKVSPRYIDRYRWDFWSEVVRRLK